MRVPVPQEVAPELLARLLAAKPLWDAYITPDGLSVLHDVGDLPEEPDDFDDADGPDRSEMTDDHDGSDWPDEPDEPEPDGPDGGKRQKGKRGRKKARAPEETPAANITSPSGGGPLELSVVRDILALISRGRHAGCKIKLHWRPDEIAPHPVLKSAGPWMVAESLPEDGAPAPVGADLSPEPTCPPAVAPEDPGPPGQNEPAAPAEAWEPEEAGPEAPGDETNINPAAGGPADQCSEAGQDNNEGGADSEPAEASAGLAEEKVEKDEMKEAGTTEVETAGKSDIIADGPAEGAEINEDGATEKTEPADQTTEGAESNYADERGLTEEKETPETSDAAGRSILPPPPVQDFQDYSPVQPVRPPVLVCPAPSPSPRLKAWLDLAASALTNYLTPPPGAPRTKGAKTLIFDEAPALLAAVALSAGAGEVTAVCSPGPRAGFAMRTAGKNGFGDRLTVLQAGLPPWPQKTTLPWVGYFDLIVINYSPYLTTKFMRAASSWLAAPNSRLVVAGLHVGQQTSLVIKAASRVGMSLLETSTSEQWTVMSLLRRRVSEFPVWEWSPGDLLSNLSEDEQEALAEADRLDGRRPSRAGALDLSDLAEDTYEELEDDGTDGLGADAQNRELRSTLDNVFYADNDPDFPLAASDRTGYETFLQGTDDDADASLHPGEDEDEPPRAARDDLDDLDYDGLEELLEDVSEKIDDDAEQTDAAAEENTSETDAGEGQDETPGESAEENEPAIEDHISEDDDAAADQKDGSTDAEDSEENSDGEENIEDEDGDDDVDGDDVDGDDVDDDYDDDDYDDDDYGEDEDEDGDDNIDGDDVDDDDDDDGDDEGDIGDKEKE
jgi:hypothetical protein